ncbi:SURF1 family protein [Pseudidiomarina sp. PP-1MA]|uniref:SURF1-like protein n=1 Tax=Pseudidiomarina sp. PP-1MA TaxID=3237706 RepID=A0AB39XA17_9GAMM
MRKSMWLGMGLTVLAIALLVKLGFWQLQRAAEKQQLFDQFQQGEAQQQTPVPLQSIEQLQDLEQYQPVTISGRFLPAPILLLDNQVWQGQVGYQVIGLFEPAAATRLIGVSLGWVAAGSDRSQLPALSLPTRPMDISGLVYTPSLGGFRLSEHVVTEAATNAAQTELIRIQRFDPTALTNLLSLPLADRQLLLAESEAWGWPRAWQPQVMSPAKHQAYALQWFSLALACLIVFTIAARSNKKKNNKECP